MGKQARLRKERKAKGGATDKKLAAQVPKWVQRRKAFEVQGDGWKASAFFDAEDVAVLAKTYYPNLDQIILMDCAERFVAVLMGVRAHQGDAIVELVAAFILLHTGNGGYPNPISDEQIPLLREMFFWPPSHFGNDADWGDAGWRVLRHMPIQDDEDDVLYPFEEMPVVSNPDEQQMISVVDGLLRWFPSPRSIIRLLGSVVWNKDDAHAAFVPLRFLLESEQGDKLWKLLDEKEWSSDSETQANIARFLKWLPYGLYLRSPHWKRVRNAALERAHHRCQVCNAAGRLEVHHRTYDRRGQELLEDVTVLCRNCHETFHRNGRLTKGEPFLGVGAGSHGL